MAESDPVRPLWYLAKGYIPRLQALNSSNIHHHSRIEVAMNHVGPSNIRRLLHTNALVAKKILKEDLHKMVVSSSLSPHVLKTITE